MVKLEDGTWKIIDVEEVLMFTIIPTFFSPVFAGIVPNHFFKKLYRVMLQRA